LGKKKELEQNYFAKNRADGATSREEKVEEITIPRES